MDIVHLMDAPVSFQLDGLRIDPETGLVSGPDGRESLPKRGYRFNGEVGSPLPVPPVPAPDVERHRPWAIAFVIFAAIAILVLAGQ